MPRLLWFLKCCGFCLVGFFLLAMVGRSITPMLSWCVYHDDPTPVARSTFAMHYYLALSALYGFLLGLIPRHQIREVLISSFANFSSRIPSTPHSELDFASPILWAWLPIGIIFFLRFILWQAPNQSVFTTVSSGRIEHFFYSPNSTSLDLFSHVTRLWILDRYVLTGPTLFLLAYPFAIWLRHQFPTRPDADPILSDDPR
jgi:hypothetical protein